MVLSHVNDILVLIPSENKSSATGIFYKFGSVRLDYFAVFANSSGIFRYMEVLAVEQCLEPVPTGTLHSIQGTGTFTVRSGSEKTTCITLTKV